MTDSNDYRKYLDKCFDNVDDSLTEIKNSLHTINNHLEKLNSKVAEHEGYKIYSEGIIKARGEQTKEIIKRVDKLEDDLLEVNFFRKYPKTIVIILAFVLCSFVGAGYVGFRKIIELNKEIKTETRVTNDVLIPPASRGHYYKTDTTKVR